MIGEDIPVSATRYDAEGVLAQLIALALQTTQQLSYIQSEFSSSCCMLRSLTSEFFALAVSVLTLLIMNIVTTFDVEVSRSHYTFRLYFH
jgi:hypothetical protein